VILPGDRRNGEPWAPASYPDCCTATVEQVPAKAECLLEVIIDANLIVEYKIQTGVMSRMAAED
jgi:hypothetical protein